MIQSGIQWVIQSVTLILGAEDWALDIEARLWPFYGPLHSKNEWLRYEDRSPVRTCAAIPDLNKIFRHLIQNV